jgi:hypothetical protein
MLRILINFEDDLESRLTRFEFNQKKNEWKVKQDDASEKWRYKV